MIAQQLMKSSAKEAATRMFFCRRSPIAQFFVNSNLMAAAYLTVWRMNRYDHKPWLVEEMKRAFLENHIVQPVLLGILQSRVLLYSISPEWGLVVDGSAALELITENDALTSNEGGNAEVTDKFVYIVGPEEPDACVASGNENNADVPQECDGVRIDKKNTCMIVQFPECKLGTSSATFDNAT